MNNNHKNKIKKMNINKLKYELLFKKYINIIYYIYI